jgi:hypothetical protein
MEKNKVVIGPIPFSHGPVLYPASCTNPRRHLGRAVCLRLRPCSVLPQSIWIKWDWGVSIPSKSKYFPIRINPLQSIWIKNNRTNPYVSYDRTSQVIRPTYSCPCPSNLRQPYRCTWSLDKFSIWIPYLAQERFTRHADITTHRRNEYAEAVTTTYFILKYRESSIITDQ